MNEENNNDQIIIDSSFLDESEIDKLIQMGTNTKNSGIIAAPTPTSAHAPVRSQITQAVAQGGGSNSGNSYGPGGMNYKLRKVNIVHFINEFQKDYTINCFKRTAPYHYTLPVSFARILLGTNALCKGSCKTDAVPLKEVLSFLGSKDGGGLKTGDTIRKDLCKMTADPFPLLESAQNKNKNATGMAEDYQSQPLYSIATGLCAEERYSKVGLSFLGQVAVGKYYDLFGRNVRAIGAIKTLVPLALLRRKTVPWTLGHKTVNYSYNPSELFRLQARMLDMAADPSNTTPWLLPDSDVAEIFKGPDIGPFYQGYMTNESLMSLYHLGVGSATFVPEIVINRAARTLEFKVPPLGMTSNDFVDYLNNRSVGKDVLTGKIYPEFKTFKLNDAVDNSDIRVIIRNVDFLGTDDEVIAELHRDPNIRVTTPLNNTVLLDEEEKLSETLKKNEAQLEEEIQDGASDNFKVDVMPIHELLWRHVTDEHEIRLECIKLRIAELEEKLKEDKFLEKVTREDVARYIASINTYDNKDNFKQMLFDKFSINSSTRDTQLLPEGFVAWEIDEIANESSKGGRTGLNITRAMFYRERYKDRWEKTEEKLNKLKFMRDNPSVIFAEIKKDLLAYASAPKFKRKTDMNFLQEFKATKDGEIDYKFIFNTETWDRLYLPCTLFSNGRYIVKSYGRNINYIPQSEEDMNMRFTHALNATTADSVYIFRRNRCDRCNVNSFSSSPADYGEFEAIIPHSDDKEILVLLETKQLDMDSGKYEFQNPRYFTIPAGGMGRYIELAPNEHIKSWCYLDKKYVEFLGYAPKLDKQTYGRIPTDQIVRSEKPMYFPSSFEVVTDIAATDNEGESVALLSREFDGTSLPLEKIFTHWPEKGEKATLQIINKDSDYMEVLSTHLECYAGKLYITDWEDLGLVAHTYYPHAKKAIINELIWCRPDDDMSIKYKTMLTKKSTSFRSSMSLIFSSSTSLYEEYNIGHLSDWSVINPRYQLPTRRPSNPAHIKFYNDYLNLMYTGKVKAKEYKALKVELEKVRTEIIESSDIDPFNLSFNMTIPDEEMEMIDIYDETTEDDNFDPEE